MRALIFVIAICVGPEVIAQRDDSGQEIVKMTWDNDCFKASIPEGDIYAELASPITYKIKNKPFVYLSRFLLIYRFPRGQAIDTFDSWSAGRIKDGYFMADGSVVGVEFVCPESGPLSISDSVIEHAMVSFSEPGQYDIQVQVGKTLLEVPHDVKEIPFEVGVPAVNIVEKFGEPVEKQRHFIEWPDSETIDGIFYSPTASEGITAVDHWKFKSLPGVTIAMENSRLRSISTRSRRRAESLIHAHTKRELVRLEEEVKKPEVKVYTAEELEAQRKELIAKRASMKSGRIDTSVREDGGIAITRTTRGKTAYRFKSADRKKEALAEVESQLADVEEKLKTAKEKVKPEKE